MTAQIDLSKPAVAYPAQCACGHLYLERYAFSKPNAKGEVGFAWCGFCRTKRMVMGPTATKETLS